MYKKIRDEIKIEIITTVHLVYTLSRLALKWKTFLFLSILVFFSDSDTENELKETFRVFSKDNEGK